MSVQVDSIFAVPSELDDAQHSAVLLARILHNEPQDLLSRFEGSRSFAWVARKVDNDTAERIRALNLHGIYFQKEPKRFYPKRELAAQVLGYVGLDDEGLGGIEREFDKDLRGKPGKMLISMDAKRRWFGSVEKQPTPGENVVLTIDEKIQFIAERELERAMQQTHAAAGTVIVENPHTGEILALANRPTFNPNIFNKVSPEQLKNRAVSDVYEPGSTFKIVTIAGAIEEKLTTPEEVVDCQSGAIYLGGIRIRDHKAFGDLTVAQIIQHSSDVGAIKIGLRLGEERFDHYIHDFGFGSTTGIELPGETRGLTKPVTRWSKVSIGAISMGQEIGVSPVQLISLIATIANDGLYTPPRVVAGTVAPQQGAQQIAFHPGEQHRVLSPLTAVEMKKMLEGVVLGGTGKQAQLIGYTAAGKTGTAQKADPNTGAYSKTHYVASFAGFAPLNDPSIAVLVVLDSPVGPHEGGQVAAPVFSRVAQQTLEYLNVPHDVDVDPKRQQLRAARSQADDLSESSPDRVDAGIEIADTDVTAALSHPPAPQNTVDDFHPVALKSKPRVEADTDVPLQTPSLPPPSKGTVVLDVTGGVEVPSFLGKPLREAVELAQQTGVEIDVVGSGVAREQSPAPGTHIPAGAHVAVRFAR
jgi:cell division protein FtsI/penicillin-binding protein 2